MTSVVGLGVLGFLVALPICGDAATVADGQKAFDAGQLTIARAIWADLSQAGEPEAAMALAGLFDLGQGVAVNPGAAYCWYRRAAEAGLPAAEFNVAVMQDSGRGTAADIRGAALWYARAAAAGHHRAEYNLAQLYATGEGLPRNPAMAAIWYRAAAAGGLAAAAERLAAMTLPPSDPAAPLLPAALDDPGDGPGLGTGSEKVALSWVAPPQPVPVTFAVEVQVRENDTWREALFATTDVSSFLAPLSAGSYAGRVFTLSAGDEPHYAVGVWTRFTLRAGAGPPWCPTS